MHSLPPSDYAPGDSSLGRHLHFLRRHGLPNAFAGTPEAGLSVDVVLRAHFGDDYIESAEDDEHDDEGDSTMGFADDYIEFQHSEEDDEHSEDDSTTAEDGHISTVDVGDSTSDAGTTDLSTLNTMEFPPYTIEAARRLLLGNASPIKGIFSTEDGYRTFGFMRGEEIGMGKTMLMAAVAAEKVDGVGPRVLPSEDEQLASEVEDEADE